MRRNGLHASVNAMPNSSRFSLTAAPIVSIVISVTLQEDLDGQHTVTPNGRIEGVDV